MALWKEPGRGLVLGGEQQGDQSSRRTERDQEGLRGLTL